MAIDRTSKFAFVQLVTSANRVTASAFLEALIAAVPYRIHTVMFDMRCDRTVEEATVERHHYDTHRQFATHLTGFIGTYAA